MGMGMTDALYTLATWFSPAYPVGAYSYSHGLEWAIGSGAVTSRQTLRDWIGDCLEHGAGRTDAILLASAWRDPDKNAIADLAVALQPSRERYLETMAQGTAFTETTAPPGAACRPIRSPIRSRSAGPLRRMTYRCGTRSSCFSTVLPPISSPPGCV